MRLTDEQVQIIHQVARQQLGDTVQITLFGSRVFDDKKAVTLICFLKPKMAKDPFLIKPIKSQSSQLL
jgi:hypothetical protein